MPYPKLMFVVLLCNIDMVILLVSFYAIVGMVTQGVHFIDINILGLSIKNVEGKSKINLWLM